MIELEDKIRGCLIGGAIGDALGYPVEFMSYNGIVRQYGMNGVTGFVEYDKNGRAVFSDDTQMTLFTANGLLFGITRWCTHSMLADLPNYVQGAYKDWYETQVGVRDYRNNHTCWIRDIKDLNVRRAPGNTCMSALMNVVNGKEVRNDSKGCGGMIRVAPVALVIASGQLKGMGNWKEENVLRYASECAAITHKHPMGYISAAVFADIVYQIMMSDEQVTRGMLMEFMDKSIANARAFYREEREINECSNLWRQLNNATRLAKSDMTDHNAIQALGEGWSGDEALVIALFCALRHIGDFNAALVAAVNHDGDSDSTCAVCGNIIGAIVGYENIHFPNMDKLEMKDLLMEIADDIYCVCPYGEYKLDLTEDDKKWERKYVFADPRITCHHLFLPSYKYRIMPKALHTLSISSKMEDIKSADDYDTKCLKAYDLAKAVFDNDIAEEPEFYNLLKEYLPAYYWGYVDPVYSPDSYNRVFKLNVRCYREKGDIIAVKDDCQCHLEDGFYKLCAGLEYVDDKELKKRFPEWLLLRINPATADECGMAVFTNQLEKDFKVEVSHFGEDEKLHRIYLLDY